MIDKGTVIGIAIILMIVTVVLIMMLSFKVSKRFSAIVFVIVFFGGAVYIGFISLKVNLFENLFMWGFIVAVIWLRSSKSFADTARARTELLERLNNKNYMVCNICNGKLSYHRKPKNIGQLLLGGLTCNNCGAEFDIPSEIFKFR